MLWAPLSPFRNILSYCIKPHCVVCACQQPGKLTEVFRLLGKWSGQMCVDGQYFKSRDVWVVLRGTGWRGSCWGWLVSGSRDENSRVLVSGVFISMLVENLFFLILRKTGCLGRCTLIWQILVSPVKAWHFETSQGSRSNMRDSSRAPLSMFI